MDNNTHLELLKAVSSGLHNPINPNLSDTQESFFCENYPTFVSLMEIIKTACTNKIALLVVTLAEAIIMGIAAGICKK